MRGLRVIGRLSRRGALSTKRFLSRLTSKAAVGTTGHTTAARVGKWAVRIASGGAIGYTLYDLFMGSTDKDAVAAVVGQDLLMDIFLSEFSVAALFADPVDTDAFLHMLTSRAMSLYESASDDLDHTRVLAAFSLVDFIGSSKSPDASIYSDEEVKDALRALEAVFSDRVLQSDSSNPVLRNFISNDSTDISPLVEAIDLTDPVSRRVAEYFTHLQINFGSYLFTPEASVQAEERQQEVDQQQQTYVDSRTDDFDDYV